MNETSCTGAPTASRTNSILGIVTGFRTTGVQVFDVAWNFRRLQPDADLRVVITVVGLNYGATSERAPFSSCHPAA